MLMLKVLAHADELHEDVFDSSAHLFESWYVALPLYALLVLAIGYVAYLVSKKSVNNTILVVNTTLLVGGLLMYSVSPTVSAVSLSLGFTMALISVLGGLKVSK